MAKRSKSKNLLKDDATYKASNSSEQDDADSDLEARETSPSMDNDAGDKEAKTDKKLTSKRRKVDISCTSSEHSRALEVVVSNEDLLTEILFLVPVKPLLNFKCVSKHWQSLITDSKFASNHSRRNPSSSLISGIYFYHKPSELNSVSLHGHLSLPTLAFLDPVRKGSESRVVDSCNGLMLFSNGRGVDYIVCNPTTQKHIALPEPGRSTTYRYVGGEFGAYLAFDPLKSPYYKVLLIAHCSSDKERSAYYRIHIYSSKSASWKEIHAKAPDGGSYYRRVFWNGAIHWMNHDNVHIRFDVDTENLTGTVMPKVPNILAEEKTRFFGECGGSLLLIQTREYIFLRFRILEMEKDCCRWIVKYRVNMMPIYSVYHQGYSREFNVLCCANGSNGKDLVLVLATAGKVMAYNLNLKSVKVLLDLQCGSYQSYYNSYLCTYRFIESLTPV
ncbi:F-box protein At5g07610-like isoform X1 [Rhododendron vialii]|uniref:F-box protein At5g07610-like isoform X1 n=1 Tax=Rhododendron vialii TaxID=182163 RepID=UPI00265DC785|nr:F-box protein At5g07610-like isoform X1 [Rhododendron vialii]